MSGISSGIGLISGINSKDLIDQLMAIEARPIDQLKGRINQLDARRAAFLELSAKLLAVRNSITGLGKRSFFRHFSTTSTNDAIVKATAGETALPGSTTLRVHSLVSNHALMSRGFADADRTSLGSGTITVEPGRAKVSVETELDLLNGGAGVRRGVITITDRAGKSAEIDLRTAVTVADVLDAINGNAEINVRASVTGVTLERPDGSLAVGDRIVLDDASAGSGNLTVADKNGGSAALDLGIAGAVAQSRLDGRDLIHIIADTPLTLLNDRNGVGRFRNGADLTFRTNFGEFNVSLGDILAPQTDLRALNGGRGVRLGVIRITDRTGKSVEVDLTSLAEQPRVTVQDVRQKISDAIDAADINATVTFVNSSFLIADTSENLPEEAKPLIVEDIGGGSAASDLGIADTADDGTIFGRAVYRVTTVGDVLRAINFAPGNDALVQASISDDGKGIALRALGFGDQVTVTAGVEDGQSSTAALDLGLAGATFTDTETFASRRLIAGLNTVLLQSLRGGRGLAAGIVSLTDRAGRTAEIDISAAGTLKDVVDVINTDTRTSIRASINSAGNGLLLTDVSGETGRIVVSDVSGELAAQLGVAGSFDADTVAGANLQLQYVARSTRLAELNGGRGVAPGDFRITDSTGAIYEVNVARNYETMGQVIDAINSSVPPTLRARINDNGDGIVITDTSGGGGVLKIEELGSRTAGDLRLAGAAATGEAFINGSYEVRIAVDAGDTLRTLADKINKSGADVTASIINDNNPIVPFSLTISSRTSGRRGELVVDASGVDLGLQTLSLARDAVVTIGGSGSLRPRLITSSSNQITTAVDGVTFDLLAVGDEDVTVTVAQDQGSMSETISTFVEKYNDALDALNEATSFNSETFAKGTLFGDSTVEFVRSRLQRVILRRFDNGDGTVQRLFSIGLRLGNGGRLQFDEAEFREAYERSPQAVEALFTKEESGFAAAIEEVLNELNGEAGGAISKKDELLTDQREVLSNRIEDMNILLAGRRARFEAQFATLESVLAGLQAQQTSLTALQQLVNQL